MICFGEEDIMIKCVGCGAVLQSDFPGEEGYTKNLDNKYCERCFNITHYNKYLKVPDKDYSQIVKEIDLKGDLILLVTDFLNLYNLDELDLKSPVLLVMTKADILPKSNFNLDLLYDKILKYKKSNNVYVIGYTNAGKSTLVNKMVKNYGIHDGEITTSNLPSTTLDLIYTEVNDDLTLIDTPGLLDNGSMIMEASKEVLTRITSKKEIRPIIYQIKGKQFLLIDDFLRIDLEDTNIICYMSNNLNFRRIYKDRPCNLKCYDLKIDANQDLVIKGLGFITFKKESHVKLWLVDNTRYLIRDSGSMSSSVGGTKN